MVVPAGVPGVAAGAAGRNGALYTGRGPVCGTIILGGGADGVTGALGAAGLAVMAGGWAAAGAVGRAGVATGALVLAELAVPPQAEPRREAQLERQEPQALAALGR